MMAAENGLEEGPGPGRGRGESPPLLLAFGRAAAEGEAFEHAELLEGVARHRGRPFGLLRVEEDPGGGFSVGRERLGDQIDRAAEGLRAIVNARAPGEVVAFGRGLGGHAALVFGVLLGAGRVVAVEPPAHLIADELALYNDRRWRDALDALARADPARLGDVPALIASRGYGGRAYVLYGTRRLNDHHDAVHLNVLHAHRLAVSDRVVLRPFPELGQDLLGELARRGEAEAVLAQHLFDDVPAFAPGEGPAPLDRKRLTLIATKLHQKFTVQVCTRGEGFDEGWSDEGGGEAEVEEVEFAVAGEVDVTATRKVDDDWRRWIAGNLMLGASPGSLEDTLVGRGISELEATQEIWRALQSPYLWGSQRLQNRLKKRDWLLAVYRKLHRLRPGSAEVPRRPGPSLPGFLREHYRTSRPAILTGMIEGWHALRAWDLDALSARFGDRQVEVELSRDALDDFEAGLEVEARTMTMADFLARLRRRDEAESVSLTAAAGSDNRPALTELWDDLGPIGEYLDPDGEDPRPGSIRLCSAGSIVPFRQELAGTLVAQVSGHTRFLLAPSWDLPLMRNTRHVYSQLDGRSTPPAPRPPLDEPQLIECRLAPGEVLFVPVGSWAFSEGLDATATVTFTNLALDNDFAGDYPAAVDA